MCKYTAVIILISSIGSLLFGLYVGYGVGVDNLEEALKRTNERDR